LKTGQAAPTVLNAANEVAVQGFLTGEIGFLDIMRVVTEALEKGPQVGIESIADVMDVDTEARRIAREILEPMRT
jgi:1-deoxy-D-xylulose-5-phosphate reductoisomerase